MISYAVTVIKLKAKYKFILHGHHIIVLHFTTKKINKRCKNFKI
jgi:hypothetical protein